MKGGDAIKVDCSSKQCTRGADKCIEMAERAINVALLYALPFFTPVHYYCR